MLKPLMWAFAIIIWLLVFAMKSGQPRRGRVLSDKQMEAMMKECIGKDQKEIRKIQHRYLYE